GRAVPGLWPIEDRRCAMLGYTGLLVYANMAAQPWRADELRQQLDDGLAEARALVGQRAAAAGGCMHPGQRQ
ncbi:MAG TPA: hypothetical protein VME46_04890, partial [Acidimicrobiales bacterium]|nr:hypothetical protein [Acidimicrobiales bacterium]